MTSNALGLSRNVRIAPKTELRQREMFDPDKSLL